MNDLINNTIQQITDIAGGFSGVETVIYRNGNLVRRSATGVETVISLDFTETDPTVPGHVKAITSTQVSNWDTAFGWGNHASAGYLTSATLQQVTTAGSVTTNSITVGGLTSTGTILAPQSTSVYALASATTPSLGLKFYASSLMIFMAGGQDTVKIGTGYFASNAPLTFGSQASAPYINYSGNNLLINAGTLTTTGYTSIQTGNLLVGTTTNAGYKLDVNGSARATSVYTADIYPITSSVNLWVNSLNAASRFYTSPVHQDGRINFNAVAGSSDQVLLRAWHTGQFGLGTGSSSAGAALTIRGDSLLVGTSGSLYFMAGTFGPVNVPYRLGITTDATTTSFHSGVQNNLTNIESHAFSFTAKSHTFYTGTTAGNQGNPNQYTPLHLSTLGNVVVGSTTDAGYKFDVAGTGRYTGTLTIQSTASDASPSHSILITTSSSGNGGRISWGDANTSILRFSNSLYFREYTGNFVFENSSTGSIPFSVRPAGTTVAIGNFVTSASITAAASALARGVYFNNTLVAAANNDTLVALDIQPVFNNGAFTGVNNYNIRTGGLITKQYFQSPTTNQGNHTIAFGFGGAGEQVKLIASAAGSTGRGNLYIATATGDAAVATTADANALFATGGNTFYKPFTIEQSTLTTGNGLVLSGNQPNGITNGIYFRFSETRVAILSKPHGATGYADFRIAIVPLGSATPNNPPQESDTKFMITKDTTNVLINTTTDAGYKLDVNGTARVKGTGTTSGTTAFIVENSGSTVKMLKTNDDGSVYVGWDSTGDYNSAFLSNGNVTIGRYGNAINFIKSTNAVRISSSTWNFTPNNFYWGTSPNESSISTDGTVSLGSYTAVASALLSMTSTTKGFLPPRMTTTQRQAIASPATSLIVFDTTLDKLVIKSSAGWEIIQSTLEVLT